MAIDPHFLVGLPPRITRHVVSRRDTVLYALGVGAGSDPETRDDLDFVYEERLVALPTMAVVLAYPGFWQREPLYGIGWKALLQAEQSITLHAPLPVEGEVRGELIIESVVDKGVDKGALLTSRRDIFDEASGALLASARQVSILRHDGGCGNAGNPPASRTAEPMPQGKPDKIKALTTRPEQALIYRLSGDLNPLHVDPAIAAEAGFSRPILAGLCVYGVVGKALLSLFCSNDPGRLRQLDCRFTSPVYPGEDMELQAWRMGPGRVRFRLWVSGRDVMALNNGHLEYEEA
ncbi:MaoC/PaaZ C-terminal domain-containing protein [Brevundimonas sp.]|uniref:MaoC/PaaZ C-terminal domain-containing protein n=1 Tax=Brevundimonas sp. TaxID=1871086 RepID=UPI001A357538|nr:MaoC/PaaZ C-terminal domain-containing protein [Brevundimonas sp.]MBJ7483892.1 MaoC family dehydratase N-terminal domain-containing protein [Brevundimonas sp.]